MNRDQAAKMVLEYALEATDRLKPEEDGYMRPDGRQLFEVQPLDEFIIDIRKELLDVVNYAAFGLHRLDGILRQIEHLNDAATEYRHTVPDLLTAIGLDPDLAESKPTSMAGEHPALRRHRQLMQPVNDLLDYAHELAEGEEPSRWDLDEAAMDGPR